MVSTFHRCLITALQIHSVDVTIQICEPNWSPIKMLDFRNINLVPSSVWDSVRLRWQHSIRMLQSEAEGQAEAAEVWPCYSNTPTCWRKLFYSFRLKYVKWNGCNFVITCSRNLKPRPKWISERLIWFSKILRAQPQRPPIAFEAATSKILKIKLGIHRFTLVLVLGI